MWVEQSRQGSTALTGRQGRLGACMTRGPSGYSELLYGKPFLNTLPIAIEGNSYVIRRFQGIRP